MITVIKQQPDIYLRSFKPIKKTRIFPTLILCGLSSIARTDNLDKATLQAEIQALKKQVHRLELNQSNAPIYPKTQASAPKKEPVVLTPNTTSADKKFHLKGITITPGGFFAMEGVWRSRDEQADIGSTYSGIPLGNNPLAHMQELRLSARQSRISTLIEGPVNPALLLSGYGEFDFLGNGTANLNESNSFNPRIRELYTTIDQTDWGWHLLAGQNWSLATTNYKGITPRNEVPPPTIDAQYVVGFIWKRQPQLRITKNMGQTLWAAVSIESPQTTFGGTACGTPYNTVLNQTCNAPGTQTFPSTTLFSLNHVPDIIAKLALEPIVSGRRIHLEGFGLYRDFYDRVEYIHTINTNHDTNGWGIGSGAVIEIIPKRLDFQGNMMVGKGIGSYATGSLPDATLALDGSLTGIPGVIFMLGATLHATEALDIYLFGGSEREKSTYFQVGNRFFGYGIPTANNAGCNIENTGICAGNTQSLWQISGGLWDKVYHGIYGDLKAGLQYSYTVKKLFAGSNNATTAAQGYETNESMVFGSIRYYPFAN